MSTSDLEEIIAYRFKKRSLLAKALTHASKASEHLERQEFLGDAVLGLVVAEDLYQRYPEVSEGDLSKMRANLVCKQALLNTAKLWQVASALNVGEGERDKRGNLKSPSIAANAVEAIIGAVFEDSGFDAAKKVVLRAWEKRLNHVEPRNLRDAKSELQELTQSKSMGIPDYKVQDLGVNQRLRFQAICSLKGEVIGQGLGQRKKEAELAAAAQALKSELLQQMMS